MHPYAAYMRKYFRNREGLDPKVHTEDELARRQLRATYYGMMSEVDDNIGRIVAALKRAGRYDDTLIVFTTDHAEMLWDHWVLGKEIFYDQAFHIPLIIRVPGKMGDATRGQRVDEFTGSIDIMPTILDLLGGEPPLQCDGYSLAPFLKGAKVKNWRQEIFWELDFRDAASDIPERELGVKLDDCSIAVVRDARYKYVQFAGGLPPVFFDLVDDPDELRNRAGDPAYVGQAFKMAQKMLSWRLSKAERTLTGIRLTKNGPVECPRKRRFSPAD